MRILLATSRLEFEAGSEMWTLTMLSALRDLGHSVDVFTVGRDIYSKSPPDFRHSYDLAIICHNTTLRALESRSIYKRIMVCHGVLPALEQPIKGADSYVAVSEETQAHMRAMGFPSAIIRNPINCTSFNGETPVQTQTVALMCSANGYPLRAVIEGKAREACQKTGRVFRILKGIPYDKLPDELRGVDLVIGAGRCILEAAACNRAVIAFDYGDKPRCGHGAIERDTFHSYRRDSFTGRNGGKNFTAAELAIEIERARGGLRDLVVAQHADHEIAAKFLRF
jgi:hypothetical protein